MILFCEPSLWAMNWKLNDRNMKVKHIKQIFFSLPSQTSRINEMSSEQTKKRKQTFQQPTTKKTTNTEKKRQTHTIYSIDLFMFSFFITKFLFSFVVCNCDMRWIENKIKKEKNKRRIKRATETSLMHWLLQKSPKIW